MRVLDFSHRTTWQYWEPEGIFSYEAKSTETFPAFLWTPSATKSNAGKQNYFRRLIEKSNTLVRESLFSPSSASKANGSDYYWNWILSVLEPIGFPTPSTLAFHLNPQIWVTCKSSWHTRHVTQFAYAPPLKKIPPPPLSISTKSQIDCAGTKSGQHWVRRGGGGEGVK